MPNAIPAGGFDRLGSWQRSTGKIVTLHHARVAGENDAERDVHAICDAEEERGPAVHVNIVGYNPFDPSGTASSRPGVVVER